jgi:hypothetical protein
MRKVNKEDIYKLNPMNQRLYLRKALDLLDKINGDSSMWKKPAISAADMYQGKPPLCRHIDTLMQEFEYAVEQDKMRAAKIGKPNE